MSRSTLADSAAAPPRAPSLTPALESVSDAALVMTAADVPAETAHALVDQGVAQLARRGAGELGRTIGRRRAVRLVAAIELGRRVVAAAALDPHVHLSTSARVVAWARPRLGTLDHEELWVLALDGRHGLRSAQCVAKGGIHGLHVGVRDVLRAVLLAAASSFILVHNHPSGDPEPSGEDIEFTKRVVAAAKTVGTPLIDHVIIARQRASSLHELGVIAGL